ncbi:MAG: glycosyltransferase family 2 protein [Promethearchaeota archaeon]
MSNNKIDHVIHEKMIKPQKKSHDYGELFRILENYKPNRNNTILSIIIPMYNEEKTIRDVLESLPNHKLIEIIVIDDNSTDNSIEEIKKAKSLNGIQIVKHSKNKGYGGAITTGMKHAKGEIVVCMDSDGQHRSDDLIELIKPITKGESDLTVGSRYLGSYTYPLPLLRQIGEILAEKVIRVFFRLKVKNNQNGFRGYNRKALKILKNAKYLDYAFCTEQILKASIYGIKLKECPTKVFGRQHGTSKLTIIKLALNIFSCLLIYYFKKINVNIAKKNKNLLSIIF